MAKPKIVSISEILAAIGSNARIEEGRKRIIPIDEPLPPAIPTPIFDAEGKQIGELPADPPSHYSKTERAWYVFRKTDVRDDPNTTEDDRWDEVGMFDARDDAISAAMEFAEA